MITISEATAQLMRKHAMWQIAANVRVLEIETNLQNIAILKQMTHELEHVIKCLDNAASATMCELN